jgi:hypothetical protein
MVSPATTIYCGVKYLYTFCALISKLFAAHRIRVAHAADDHWVAFAQRGHRYSLATLCLLQPNARLVAVGELDAGLFQGALDSFDGARLQRLAGFEARNRAWRDFGELGDIANSELERSAGHSGLCRRHRNSAPI